MGQHVPESLQGDGRDLDAELGEIALDQGVQELAAPGQRISFGAADVRQRKAAAQPMSALSARAEISQAKALQIHGLQSAGQGLRRLLEKRGRNAAENQKTRWQRLAIGQHAQECKELRPALDFIDHDDAFERAQSGIRLGQAGHAPRVLEIEIIERLRGHKLPGQRRLAALTRTEQRHDSAAPQGRAHDVGIGFAIDHALILHHENLSCNDSFSWYIFGVFPSRFQTAFGNAHWETLLHLLWLTCCQRMWRETEFPECVPKRSLGTRLYEAYTTTMKICHAMTDFHGPCVACFQRRRAVKGRPTQVCFQHSLPAASNS